MSAGEDVVQDAFLLCLGRLGHPRPRAQAARKAKVEQGVLLAEQWILAVLRNRTFFSLEEVREAVKPLVEKLNNRPMRKLKKSRRELFEEVERASLKLSAGEDVVQDAFLLCLGRLGQLRNPAQFRPWLLSIVVSLSSKRLRRERLLKWMGLDAVADAQLAVPERTELQHAWMSTWARSGRSWAEPEFATRPHRRLLERFTTRKPASPQLSVH